MARVRRQGPCFVSTRERDTRPCHNLRPVMVAMSLHARRCDRVNPRLLLQGPGLLAEYRLRRTLAGRWRGGPLRCGPAERRRPPVAPRVSGARTPVSGAPSEAGCAGARRSRTASGTMPSRWPDAARVRLRPPPLARCHSIPRLLLGGPQLVSLQLPQQVRGALVDYFNGDHAAALVTLRLFNRSHSG